MPSEDSGVKLFAYIPSVADIGIDARYRDYRGLGRDRLMITVGLSRIKNNAMLIVYHVYYQLFAPLV